MVNSNERYYIGVDFHAKNPDHFFPKNFKNKIDLVITPETHKVPYNDKETLFSKAIYLGGNARNVIKTFNKTSLIVGEPFWFSMNNFVCVVLINNDEIKNAFENDKLIHVVFRQPNNIPITIEYFKILENDAELQQLINLKKNEVGV
jgi:hypothetical protein